MLLSFRNCRDALGEISDFRPIYTSFGKPRVKPHEKSATGEQSWNPPSPASRPFCLVGDSTLSHCSPQDLTPESRHWPFAFFSQHARTPHFSAPAAPPFELATPRLALHVSPIPFCSLPIQTQIHRNEHETIHQRLLRRLLLLLFFFALVVVIVNMFHRRLHQRPYRTTEFQTEMQSQSRTESKL